MINTTLPGIHKDLGDADRHCRLAFFTYARATWGLVFVRPGSKVNLVESLLIGIARSEPIAIQGPEFV